MKTATINGITMAYRDEGAGQPILFIHAFPLHSALWERQIAAFAAHDRVIAPDLRGLGASARGSGAASLDQHADDLDALLGHLGITSATIVGLSMGGYIAFALWRRHRERIGALILADTRAGADTEEGKQGRENNAQLAEAQGAGAIADQMLPKLLAPNAPAVLRDEVRAMIESNDRAGIAAALRAMAARPDSTPLLATIDVPTLVLVGSEDALTPPSEAEAMFNAIPGCRIAQLPGAGHLSNLEAPEAFNAQLADFLTPRQTFGVGGGGGGKW
jgi:pimeloyl-ACP methyl ester carboxylesterase